MEWHTSVKFLEDTPGGTILGGIKRDEDPESLTHPGTPNDNDDDSSDDDDTTNQPNFNQVGVLKTRLIKVTTSPKIQ